MAKPESRRIKAARREDEVTVILQLYHSYFVNWQKGAGDGSEEGESRPSIKGSIW